MTDLVFGRLSPSGTDLVFGDAATGTVVNASGVAVVRMRGFGISARGIYDSEVLRGPVAQASASWQSADRIKSETAINHTSTVPIRPSLGSSWGASVRMSSARESAWASLQRNSRIAETRWAQTEHLGAAGETHWKSLVSRPRAASARWEDADELSSTRASEWGEMLRNARAFRVSEWQTAVQLSVTRAALSGESMPLNQSRVSRWQNAMHARPGISVRPVDPSIPPDPTGDTNILFHRIWNGSTAIVFGGDGGHPGQIVVPVRRIYLVINDLSLVRAADGLSIPATSLSISADVDSFQIGFDASISGAAFDDVMPAPDPVELIATINGTAFRLVVESVSRDRSFGKRSVAISGRGWAAQLSDPFAAVSTWSNTESRTAQQLAAETLPDGWSLDWMLDDWLVPAGAWSFTGTPASAIARIAESVGGYVVPGRSSKVLSVRHRYPSAPWDWASISADLVLPADVATKEGLKVVSKAEYDAVYVSGETAGYLGSVKRAGTAGSRQAQMVTDALMTDVLAVRQRGRAILSDTGLQITPTLELQVLPETGIIGIGALIEFHDGAVIRRGLVRANKVSATMPKVRQSIEVETHA